MKLQQAAVENDKENDMMKVLIKEMLHFSKIIGS